MQIATLLSVTLLFWAQHVDAVGTISGFRLVRSRSGSFISNLVNGTVVYLNGTTPGLTVVAVPDRSNGRIRSVLMKWDKRSRDRREFRAPYTLCGGRYRNCPSLVAGKHTVTATVRGGAAVTVSFEIAAGVAPPKAPTAPVATAPVVTAPKAAPVTTPSTPVATAPVMTAPNAAPVPTPTSPATAPAASAPKAPVITPVAPPVVAPLTAPVVASAPKAATAPVVTPVVAPTTPVTAPVAAPKALSAPTGPVVAPTSGTAPSNQDPAPAPVKAPVPTPTPSAIKINCGGGAFKDWMADNFFNGSGSVYPPNPITNPIANTVEDELYWTERNTDANAPLKYEIPVAAAGSYTVVLHFAEIFFDFAGQRTFSVKVENSVTIPNIDIIALVGKFSKLTKSATVVVSDGTLSLEFIKGAQNAVISAIEVFPAAPGAPIGTPVAAPVAAAPVASLPVISSFPYYISAGGVAYNGTNGALWVSDTIYNPGGSVTILDANLAIANTNEDGLYRKERFGAMLYKIPIVNGPYQVVMHFSESFAGAAIVGGRVFKVIVESVLSNSIDIFAATNALNTAYKVPLNVTVSDGELTIGFGEVVNNFPQVCGIEIIKV